MIALRHIALTCPICARDLASTAPIRFGSAALEHTDFHGHAAGLSTPPYRVHVCPRGGFAGAPRPASTSADPNVL